MDRRRLSTSGKSDAASPTYTNGQFQSRATVSNVERITERNADLQRAPANSTHHPSHVSDVEIPATNESERITVRLQPSSTVRHGSQDLSSGLNSLDGMTPMQRWSSEAAKAQPWNGLGQVPAESGATTEVPQIGKRSKSSSMETGKDNTSQGSFNNDSRRNGCP